MERRRLKQIYMRSAYVLITGKLPKEEKAKGEVWVIVDRCIKLDPEERYSDEELLSVLNTYLEKGV